MGYIITHTSPDWDAIGYAWLMQRYGGATDMDVRFVNTGAPDADLLASAYSVGDTGREYDPARRRFDHHHLTGAEANATCATLQTAQWLVLSRPDVDLTPIWSIVDLIYAGDTGKPEANQSRAIGIHALLSAVKATRRFDDAGLLRFGYDILDLLADGLTARDIARRTLADHTVYTSADGLVVGLLNAPQGATFAAHEAGARLVVFASDLPGPTYARGIMRGGEGQDVHVGHLISWLCNDYECGLPNITEPVYEEIATWYRHEAGFFAGKGTAKAPCAEPMQCGLIEVAAAIDSAWIREAA